ncbi:MAG: putative Ig domain-containing protein, partial [Flavobacteriales bacterium]
MNKSHIIFLGFAFLLFLFKQSKCQFYGADITYEQVGSNTYEIQLKILAEKTVTLPDSFYSFSKTDSLIRCDSLKTYNFKRTETYPGGGFYWISFKDSTRNRVAINSPGLTEEYYCAGEVVLGPNWYAQTSTIKFHDKPHIKVEKGDTLNYHPAFTNEEGDSLFFELRQLDDSSGYLIPSGITVNPKSGEFIWASPDTTGLYEFTLEVKEYGAPYKGRVFRNFTVRVLDSLNSRGKFQEQGGFNYNSNGFIEQRIKPGETLTLNLNFV